MNSPARPGYNRVMLGMIAKAAVVALALFVATTGAQAQTTRYKHEQRRAPEPAPPSVPFDKRDAVVTAPGVFNGRPYWLALAECGGIYFKLNVFYTDAAVHARVVKPDPKANTEYTKELNEAIRRAAQNHRGRAHRRKGLPGDLSSLPGGLSQTMQRTARAYELNMPRPPATHRARRSS